MKLSNGSCVSNPSERTHLKWSLGEIPKSPFDGSFGLGHLVTMHFRTVTTLGLLILAGCEKQEQSTAPLSNQPTARSSDRHPSSDPFQGVDEAKARLLKASDTRLDLKERAPAINAIAEAYGQNDIQEGINWIGSLKGDTDREIAWAALIRSAKKAGKPIGINGALAGTEFQKEYLSAVSSARKSHSPQPTQLGTQKAPPSKEE